MVNTHGKTTDEIFLEDLKQEFLESVPIKLKQMNVFFKHNNLVELAKIAHDIKGTAGVFELWEGTDIADELQKVAKEGKVEETRTWLEKLTVYMKENGAKI